MGSFVSFQPFDCCQVFGGSPFMWWTPRDICWERRKTSYGVVANTDSSTLLDASKSVAALEDPSLSKLARISLTNEVPVARNVSRCAAHITASAARAGGRRRSHCWYSEYSLPYCTLSPHTHTHPKATRPCPCIISYVAVRQELDGAASAHNCGSRRDRQVRGLESRKWYVNRGGWRCHADVGGCSRCWRFLVILSRRFDNDYWRVRVRLRVRPGVSPWVYIPDQTRH